MPSRRRYSRSRSAPKRYRWLQNASVAFTALAAGSQAIFDLLQGISDSELAMNVVKRMLLNLTIKPPSQSQDIQWDQYVIPMDVDQFDSGSVPEGEIDIKQYYLNDNGIFHSDADAGPRLWYKTYDIRTSRKLPGSRQALAHVIKNVHATNSLEYNVSSRILLQLP